MTKNDIAWIIRACEIVLTDKSLDRGQQYEKAGQMIAEYFKIDIKKWGAR